MNNRKYSICKSCGMLFLVSSLTGLPVFNNCDDHWYCGQEVREQPHIHHEIPHPFNTVLLDSTFSVSAGTTLMDESTSRMLNKTRSGFPLSWE